MNGSITINTPIDHFKIGKARLQTPGKGFLIIDRPTIGKGDLGINAPILAKINLSLIMYAVLEVVGVVVLDVATLHGIRRLRVRYGRFDGLISLVSGPQLL